MAALSNLIVSLTAETAQFTASMNRAASQSQRNFDQIKGAAKIATGVLAGFFAIQNIQGFIRGQLDAADAIAKVADKTGLTVEAFSRLQNASALVGVSSAELENGLIKLTQAIGRNDEDGKRFNETLARLGINARDASGATRSTEEVLFDLADAYAKTSDPARRLAIAQELNVKGFERLIPLLSQGREGLKQYSATFTDDFARSAEQFNDSITKLNQNLQRTAATLLGPVLEAVNRVFFDTFTQKGLDTELEKINNRIQKISDELSGIDFSLSDPVTISRTNQLTAELEKLSERANQLTKRRSDLNKTQEIGTTFDIKEKSSKKSVNDIIEEQRRQYQSLIFTKNELLLIDANLAGATNEQITQLIRINEAIEEYQRNQEEVKRTQEEAISLAQEWKSLYEDTRSAVQKLTDEEARLLELEQRLLAAGYDRLAVERAIAEARLNLTENTVKANRETQNGIRINQEFGTAIASNFENAILRGSSLRDVLRGILQDIIAITVRTAITKPFADAISIGIGNVFGGPRAMGGPVKSGTTYLVGEKGPELFTPALSGTITPNDKMGGTNNVVVNVNMQNGSVDASSANRLGVTIGNLVKAELIKQARPGGLLAA